MVLTNSKNPVNRKHLIRGIISGLLGVAFLAAVTAAPACEQEVKVGDLVIAQAWSRYPGS
jgi:hypothetical protein